MFEIIISIILAVMAIMLFLQHITARNQSERIKLLEDIWLPEDEAEELKCEDEQWRRTTIALNNSVSALMGQAAIKVDIKNIFRLLPKICRYDTGEGEVMLCLQKEGCACEEADGEKDGEDCECATCENNTREQNLCVYYDAVYCDNCGIGNGYGRCGYRGEEE